MSDRTDMLKKIDERLASHKAQIELLDKQMADLELARKKVLVLIELETKTVNDILFDVNKLL